MNEQLSLSSNVVLSPHRAGLAAGQPNLVEVLVRVQAPDAPQGHAAHRPTQALALVIDRSGSMAGRPLDEARNCANYVLGMLRPADTVSLVQFDNRVQRLWPAVPMGDAAPLRAALASMEAGGNTHLHGGWREGVATLGEVAGQGLKRVILLSDGQANAGLTEPAAIAAQCAQWAASGITTSTYGLGRSFNEDLMVAMARAGGGNHYYGDTAEDLMEPFQQELELLGNLCLRDLRLKVQLPDGVEVTMVNDLRQVDGGWRLPDLAWGAEAWAVLRLQVPVTSLPAAGGSLPVLQVSVQGLSLAGEPVELERSRLALPVLSPAAFGALVEDELVARRLEELDAADALAALRTAAALGDWAAVDAQVQQAQVRFSGNAWVAAMLAAMKDISTRRDRNRMMKESIYSSTRLSSRLAARSESGAYASEAGGASGPAYLRRKVSQGKGDL